MSLAAADWHTSFVALVPSQPRFRAAAILAGQAVVWLLLTLAFAALIQIAGLSSWKEALSFSATNWLPWIVLGPLVFWLANRFPFERGHLWRAVPLHFIACVTCCFVMLGVSGYFAPWPRGSRSGPMDGRMFSWERRESMPPLDPAVAERMMRERRDRSKLVRTERVGEQAGGEADIDGPADLRADRVISERWGKDGRGGYRGPPGGGGSSSIGLRTSFLGRFWPPFSGLVLRANVSAAVYLMIACFAHAFSYYRRAQLREREAIALNAGLARAKLDALRLQLQPHFLFNTLNAISTLVHRDPAAADELIGDLSELLRLSLQTADHEVPLSRELELLECYLAIEQTRLGERLRIVREIDSQASTALVPTFVLQPLAENAIRHGIEPRLAPGTLTIRAELADGKLRLVVADNGVGLKTNGARGDRRGIGIANTEQRLRALHGDAASLQLTAPDSGGVRVEIVLPVRFTPSALAQSA